MLAITYCKHCRENLIKYGELAALTYEQVCEHFIISGECMEFTCSYPIYSSLDEMFISKGIKFLEEKGYVISTEKDYETICVKPCGIDCQKEFDTTHWNICFDRERHK